MWGSAPADGAGRPTAVRVRFSNNAGRTIARAEAHLIHRPAAGSDPVKVTFDWTDDAGAHRASHVFADGKAGVWDLPAGRNVKTRWVEFEAVR